MKFLKGILVLSLLIACSAPVKKTISIADQQAIESEKKIDQAVEFYEAGNYAEALKLFQSIDLDKDVYGFEVANYIGIIYFKQKNYDDAKSMFRKSIRLYNEFADAHNNLGFIYFLQARYEQALNEFDVALLHDPNHENAKINLRLVDDILAKEITLETIEMFGDAKSLQSLDKKIDAYKEIIKKQPNLKEAKNNLAVCYFYKNNFKEARSILEELLKKHPKYYEAHNNYAYLLFKESENDLSKRHLMTSIKLKPSYIIALINLGEVYAADKDYVKAEKVWRTVIQVQPRNSFVISKLKNLNEKKNELDSEN